MQQRTPLSAAHKLAALFSLSFLAVVSPTLSAQTVTFYDASMDLPNPSFLYVSSYPAAIAIDAAGDVYVSQNNAVLKMPPGGGLPQIIASFGSRSSTGSLAIDSAGDLFVILDTETGPVGSDAVDTYTIVEIPASGGSPTTVFTNFTSPSFVGADYLANVYINACMGSTCGLWKIPSNGTGTPTLLPIQVGGPLAVDGAGDVYLVTLLPKASPSQTLYQVQLSELPANSSTVTSTVLPVQVLELGPVAADAVGDVLMLGSGSNDGTGPSVYQLKGSRHFGLGGSSILTGLAFDPQGDAYAISGRGKYGQVGGIQEIQVSGSANLGNVNACTSGPVGPLPCSNGAGLFYNVTTSGTLGTPTISSGGSPNSDFTIGTSSCNGAVTAGSTCSVGVTFTPLHVGVQTAIVRVVDSNNNVLATTQVTGTGVSPNAPTFITADSFGPLRNDYTGYVGYQFTTGPTAITEVGLQRLVAPGNSQVHTLKLVQQDGTVVDQGGVNTAGVAAGQYAYTSNEIFPVLLQPNTTYYVVSSETAGGDQWYNFGPLTSAPFGTVIGPTYTDASNNYITVSGLSGQGYVPVSFLYAPTTTAAPLTVNITAPTAGATISGTTPVTVSTTGAVSTLQLQVDGMFVGTPVMSSSTVSLDTTKLTNGTHSITVVAADAQSDTVTSTPVSVTVNNVTVSGTPFVSSQTLGSIRNNYSGFVGFYMTTGSTALTVSSLGRYVAPGNGGTHVLKLVSSGGTDVPGGTASLSLAGKTAGSYAYAPLASPITLQAGTAYFLVSQETAGGDSWYDFAPVATTSAATVTAPVYTDGGGHYVSVSFAAGDSYVPLNFQYQTGGTTSLSATITSPSSGAMLSGNNIPVTVSTTGSFSSLQLQVDGTNQGQPVTASPLTLNTLTLSNGTHTLTVVISMGGSSAVSPGVSVTVNNGSTGTPTPLITGETPSTLRNNYSGYVGTEIKVGATPLTVTALGRLLCTGNNGSHVVKLVQANGTDLSGGSTTVILSGVPVGQFAYASLASPVTLAANTSYYLVSQETAGADNWYDLEPVVSNSAAQILGPVYTDGHGSYVLVGGMAGYSYVPVNFQYQ